MPLPKKGPGRPKGSQNRTTVMAKEAIALAADALGGAEGLVKWAKRSPKHQTVFWSQIYTKLLPLQVNGPGPSGEHLIRKIEREIVDPKPAG